MIHSDEAACVTLRALRGWVETRDFAGYEPYDILNAKRLPGFLRETPIEWFLIQATKRFPSNALRKGLRVPPSKNPKALGLFLSAYCDLARGGEDTAERCQYLKRELVRLRSAESEYFCWGYDWDYISLRGSSMRAFRPNSIASVFCGQALLDLSEVFDDKEAAGMAASVGEWFVRRLNRSVDDEMQLCFSYTPENNTRVYNTSALVGAFLARLAGGAGNFPEYVPQARRVMTYLANQQHADGSWSYGADRRQQWVDNFHTGYNLCALMDYERATGDTSFQGVLKRGYDFYRRKMFMADGAPKYFSQSAYPIDIHSCAQAILVFSDFSEIDGGALLQAGRVLRWTIDSMRNQDGSFSYQKHHNWINRVAYMRWGQAWMFRALAHFQWKAPNALKESDSGK